MQEFLLHGTFVSVIGMVGLAWVIRGDFLWRDLFHYPGWFGWLAGPVLGMCTAVGGALLYEKIPRLRRFMPAEVLAMMRRMPVGLWLVVAVSGSAAEEILFRGALQPIFGMVITNLLFGFFHFWAQRRLLAYGIGAFLMGMLLSVVFSWTHSLLTVILMHTTHNLVVSAWIMKSPRFGEGEDIREDQEDGSTPPLEPPGGNHT
ncbi:MAG: CPBP family intramembrane metalloprotease [Acidobacteria bacterium]|nr:CPBP family intramembrane metalloprotease [Acidobacteriota bacterium]